MTNAVRTQPWPIFSVEIYPFDPFLYTAATKAKARWRAFTAFREHYQSESFADFLARGVSLRKLERPPADDGYDNVRAQYSVYPRIGRRGQLVYEGSSSGRQGIVIYPGRSTCMVHMVLDGEEHSVIVQPMNVAWLD